MNAFNYSVTFYYIIGIVSIKILFRHDKSIEEQGRNIFSYGNVTTIYSLVSSTDL